MKYSVEDEIMRHPAGTETDRPPVTVSGASFLYYDIGGGRRVWRTPDQTCEVGRRGGGGAYYAKINGHIVEQTFHTRNEAMRLVASTLTPHVEAHRR